MSRIEGWLEQRPVMGWMIKTHSNYQSIFHLLHIMYSYIVCTYTSISCTRTCYVLLPTYHVLICAMYLHLHQARPSFFHRTVFFCPIPFLNQWISNVWISSVPSNDHVHLLSSISFPAGALEPLLLCCVKGEKDGDMAHTSNHRIQPASQPADHCQPDPPLNFSKGLDDTLILFWRLDDSVILF